MALPPRYSFETAYSHYFFEFENEKLFKRYITCGFILERPIKLNSFKALGVQKLVEDRRWESTIDYIPRFVTKVVHEFYANLSDNINVQREPQFEKVFVKGHMYEFSPRAICESLNISIPENFNCEKEYVMDDVAIEQLGYKCVWPKINVFRVADLTLKYNGIHKIALSN